MSGRIQGQTRHICPLLVSSHIASVEEEEVMGQEGKEQIEEKPVEKEVRHF